MIEVEIDDGESTDFRRRVLAVVSREFRKENSPIPKKTCTDRDEWRHVVDFVMDQILWDRDYEDFTDLMDAPPEKANATKEFLQIDTDYYTMIPPHLPDAQ